MALKNQNHFTSCSRYLSFLLRHHPEVGNFDIDTQGWVNTQQLIENINSVGLHKITLEELQDLVATYKKERYCFSADGTNTRVCQGHSISWVKIELPVQAPPKFLFYGTNEEALNAIMKSGAICRMERHTVHMQPDEAQAWQSARRWKGKRPVVLKIAAAKMAQDGYQFCLSGNHVWLCGEIPTKHIVNTLYHKSYA